MKRPLFLFAAGIAALVGCSKSPPADTTSSVIGALIVASWRHGAFAALLVLGALACRTSSAPPASPATGPPSVRPVPPPPLESFESAVEDLGEAAKMKDWAKAQVLLTRGQVSWSSVEGRVVADGASPGLVQRVDAVLDHLRLDVSSQNSRAAESNANAVGGAIADLFELYSDAVPADVLRLDVAFRHVQIGAEYSNWTDVARGLADVRTTWLRLRSGPFARVQSRSAARGAADRVQRTIRGLQSALDAKAPSDVEGYAREGLELVDELEQLFQ